MRATFVWGLSDSHFIVAGNPLLREVGRGRAFGNGYGIGGYGYAGAGSGGGALNATVTSGPEFTVPDPGYGWSTGASVADPTPTGGSIAGGNTVNGYTLTSFWWQHT